MLVRTNASGAALPQSVNGARCQVAVASENELFGNGIDTNYVQNDQVLIDVLRSGCVFNGIVRAGTPAIADRAFVTSDGGGGIKTGTTDNAIGRALGAVNNATGSTAVRLKVDVL